ncbi:MAG: nickel pincer cofactor biosynthesis protein LarB [Armatimonadota bacterium]
MADNDIADLLRRVKSGEVDIDEALHEVRNFLFEDIGFAKLDHHRVLRQGFPEVIFCQGKSTDHIVAIAKRLEARGGTILASRATPEQYEALREAVPGAVYHEQARLVSFGDPSPQPPSGGRPVLVITAGTADIPVAEEAAVTAEMTGARVERLWDVGVAGIHRLLRHRELLDDAEVIIVVAGMEGALASVVGGLVDKPVIAVPTSVGYGASFEGLAALLAMLNACAAGVVVVNIDNGFGAGYFAGMLARRSRQSPQA